MTALRPWPAVLLAALLALPAASTSAGPQGHDHAPLPAAQASARQQRLDTARQALSRGDADAALVPLEEAAGMSHDADTELLQLQMLLQRGQVRQAMAFAAHTAAAHRDEPQARELHLWLLALSGQTEHVRRRLTPSDGPLAGLLDALAAPDGLLPAAAPTPWPHGTPVPADSRARATALLLHDGHLALAPLSALPAAGEVWLRSGLGRASRARPTQAPDLLAPAGFAWLDVDPPLPPPAGATGIVRRAGSAFAGSPAFRLAMPRTPDAAPSWPQLQMGFLGRQDLGWPAGAALDGGPVLDVAGRLIGLAARGADGVERLVPWTGGPPRADLPVSQDARPRSPDEIYEATLPFVAQVLVAP